MRIKIGKKMIRNDLTIYPNFIEVREIIPGSPYNQCSLQLIGHSWLPDLPERIWQDYFATDEELKYLALAAWNIDKENNPGFNIFVIDTEEKTVTKSQRYCGWCNSLSWIAIGVRYTISGFYICTDGYIII